MKQCTLIGRLPILGQTKRTMMKDKLTFREKLFRAGITLVIVTIMSVAMLRQRPTKSYYDDP